MDYSYLLIPFVVLAIVSIGYTIWLRRFHRSAKPPKRQSFSIAGRTKYAEVNVFRHRGIFLKMGLSLSLAFVLMAFSWTSTPQKIDYIDTGIIIEDIQVIPRTPPEKKPTPPQPPPPVIEEVKDEEIIEEPKLESMDIDAETVIDDIIEEPVEVIEKAPSPPPLPEPEEVEDEIFSIAEEMPVFPGCNNGSKAEKKACTEKQLMTFMAKNLKYPAIARENGIQGRLFIRFVVDNNGTIQDAQILRDIGAGCGDAALDVINSMNDVLGNWTPGKQRGNKVKVMYTMPVFFNLD